MNKLKLYSDMNTEERIEYIDETLLLLKLMFIELTDKQEMFRIMLKEFCYKRKLENYDKIVVFLNDIVDKTEFDFLLGFATGYLGITSELLDLKYINDLSKKFIALTIDNIDGKLELGDFDKYIEIEGLII